MRPVLAVALALLVAGCSAPAEQQPVEPAPSPSGEPRAAVALPDVALAPVAAGFDAPVLVTYNPDSAGDELYVVEQTGRIWRVVDGQRDATPWLDLRGKVKAGGEQGLLGLAFTPVENSSRGTFFVSYTDVHGDSILARYHHRGGANATAEPDEEVLLKVDQPFANHNGGHVAFSPMDGHLYYGLGDGGAGGDPQGNGQNPDALLGSMLRLDVREAPGYRVPPDNPFVAGGGAQEVWAKGVRNPWRFSFDPANGDLWIGDVGQSGWEEIDLLPANASGPWNLGWNAFEGRHRYDRAGPDAGTFSVATEPVFDYPTDEGCAVTGGFVYRGAAIPALQGHYVFGDYCAGDVWVLSGTPGARTRMTLLETERQISSFGEDRHGELYVVDHGGAVLKIVPRD